MDIERKNRKKGGLDRKEDLERPGLQKSSRHFTAFRVFPIFVIMAM